jgi:hypothetical protein
MLVTSYTPISNTEHVKQKFCEWWCDVIQFVTCSLQGRRCLGSLLHALCCLVILFTDCSLMKQTLEYSFWHLLPFLKFPIKTEDPSSYLKEFRDQVVPVRDMKAYKGSRGMAPLIFNIGARWRWVVSITPRPLWPWEGSPVPTEQEAGWSQKPLWMVW